MTALAMSKPWIELTAPNVAAVPGQLGVFELAGADEIVVRIGYAGGRELFGLRSALDEALGRRDSEADPLYFRYECTHGYLTRWEELLMVHQARHGRLPDGNVGHPHRIGRLTIS